MRTFTVNGKEYNAKDFGFNLVCDLEDMGVSLEEMKKKPLSVVRAYFGMCAGVSKENAGKEMEEHMKKGGKLDDIMDAMAEKMEESDFFRSLSENAEKEAAENPEKQGEEKK